jgi:hypothetical protein
MDAHIIQVALTPVFLLSGIATLLNVFSTRLARVADRVDQITKGIEGTDEGEDTLLTEQLDGPSQRSARLRVSQHGYKDAARDHPGRHMLGQ